MKKKIICMVMVLAMLFFLCGCSKVNNLEQDRVNAITSIETYAEGKGQENYSAENWLRIEEIVSEGKHAILLCQSIAEIEDIITSTKQEIDGVLVADVLEGQFCSLQEAYESNILTKSDLKSIADTPRNIAKDNVIKISDKVQYAIKNTYIQLENQLYGSVYTIEEIIITSFFGKYNDSYVVKVTSNDCEYPAVDYKYVIGGVVITYTPPEIIVWVKS